MPKVSVVVPIYGVEAYIERCVRSLFSQTLTDIEYIFVDDCSPDSSVDILEKLIEEFSHVLDNNSTTVKIYRMPINSGQAAVRNFAIQKATGEYVIHCDSDDWIDYNMYKSMYEVAAQTNSDVVVCDFYQSNSQEDQYIKACYDSDKQKFLFDLMIGRGYWSLCNKLVRKELYNKIQILPSQNMGEDMLITFQLLYYANRISYIESAFYYYYVNPLSIVRNVSTDNVISRFTQVIENVNYLECFLENHFSNNSILLRLDSLKYRQLNILNPILSDANGFNLWRSTYPKLKYRIWMNPYISIKDKIKFYLRIWNLYK